MSDDTTPDANAVPERLALHVPNAQRAEVARRLLDTPAAQDDPLLIRTFSGGFVVPSAVFDQAYPDPDAEQEPTRSPAHPAGKGRAKADKS
jgi:hypothetical protein